MKKRFLTAAKITAVLAALVIVLDGCGGDKKPEPTTAAQRVAKKIPEKSDTTKTKTEAVPEKLPNDFYIKQLKNKAEKGGWIFKKGKDEFTDEVSFAALKPSSNSIRFMMKQERPLLMFLRHESKNAIVINMGNYIHVMPFLGNESYNVRIDKNEPMTLLGQRIWQGTGLAFVDVPEEFLNQLRLGKKLTVKIETLGLGTHNIVWNLSGTSEALTIIFDNH